MAKTKKTAGVTLEEILIEGIIKQHVSELQKVIVKPINKQETIGTVLASQIEGDHYKKLAEYQPWSVMSKWLSPDELKGYMKGTVCAYLCREADKGGLTDIEKALHTMQIYLEVSK